MPPEFYTLLEEIKAIDFVIVELNYTWILIPMIMMQFSNLMKILKNV
ncbi:hypothetical protein Bsph_2639 [Lysinibacillus sphaericus C3-41]|uniref:Uncharacterized protein n=1 Tax=Lysinibacillus sphaericus (strain C3-41) TaxID=444177 RepID=B1HYM0_LYSSC|nr:hypothetical protein Bsph_2639 [Lysinibacillus sphaericus C3-41]